MLSLKNLAIILVRAENPVNIGQVARAMKNFGLSKLILVRCAPHQVPQAYAPGWKARDILDRAACPDNLKQVIKKFTLTVGLTSRVGKRRGEPITLAETIPRFIKTIEKQKAAFVLGNEKNGLSNEELKACHLMASIPTSSLYSSLNLSHAVAIAASSIFEQTSKGQKRYQKPERYQTSPRDFRELMQEFRKTLRSVGYANTKRYPLYDEVTTHFEHYFKRAGLERRDLRLFHAFLSRIKQRVKS
jgi:tRNA/rRNA methyltransferase